MGSYYDELTQYDKALTYFEKALAEYKKTAEICDVYYYVASVYLKKKDKDNALKQYNYLKLYNKNLAEKLLQEIERIH